MPHDWIALRASWESRLRIALIACAVMLVAAGCHRTGEPDSTAASHSREASRPAPPAIDSAAVLDSAFQRERLALNAEGDSLAGLERRSPEYATRYAAFMRRAAAAESLRARRDQLRKKGE